jgi:hypothetical protein
MGLRIIAASLAIFWLAACGSDSKSAPDANMTCAAPGATAYLAVCTANTDCQSCLCSNFGHEMACTKACTVDGDCPTPSGGCTQGVCRP